jgi:glycosidase
MKKILLGIPLISILVSCTGNPSASSDSLIPTSYEIESISNLNGSVFYEIFVRSFVDSNQDGIGDIYGMQTRLPYLKKLGVAGLWLMPIHPSPSYHGYDVTDYKAIREKHGTIDDFEAFTTAAAEHNIDVIIDLVVNHSSSQHPWFIEGKKNYTNNDCAKTKSYCDYYNFRRENGVVLYESNFGGDMPDLNLNSENVRQEIIEIMTFWLNRGVDGFRLDAVTYFTNNRTDNIAFLNWLKAEAKKINPKAYIVGEAWIDTFSFLTPYYASSTDSFFHFPLANQNGYLVSKINQKEGLSLANYFNTYNTLIRNINPHAIDAPFISNHDMNRSATWFTLDRELRQKLAASVYLLAPGRPFIYYGEEIAIRGTRGAEQTDANRRLPMIWSEVDDLGRTNPPPGATFDPELQVKKGAFDLIDLPFSLTNHYQKVISIRNKYPYMENGMVSFLNLGNSALFALEYFSTTNPDDSIVVVHNFESTAVQFSWEGAILEQINTTQSRPFVESGTLTLAPYSTVILQNA